MGRLGWSRAQALAEDVNVILIAWDGRQDADHDLYTAIFAAQGKKLPPRKQPEHMRPTAGDVKAWARQMRARMSKKRTAEEAKAAAIAKAGQGTKP